MAVVKSSSKADVRVLDSKFGSNDDFEGDMKAIETTKAQAEQLVGWVAERLKAPVLKTDALGLKK
jgi:hypothetical protein